jgi:hypothetical protein
VEAYKPKKAVVSSASEAAEVCFPDSCTFVFGSLY